MDSGWASAYASIGTTLIVLGTAVAAFLQLRHYRNANDTVVYFRLTDFMDGEIGMAGRRSMKALAEKAKDPVYFEQLKDRDFQPEEMRQVANLLRFLEHISVLITKGGIAEGLVLAEYADIFVELWDQARPAIHQRRYAFGKHTGRAFEHLAMRSKAYIDSGDMDRDYARLASDPRTIQEI